VFASEIIRREIELLKRQANPSSLRMSSTAASGGYYISMNADENWASRKHRSPVHRRLCGTAHIGAPLAKLGAHGRQSARRLCRAHIERSLTADQRELLQLSIEHDIVNYRIGGECSGKSPDDIDPCAGAGYGPVAMRKNAVWWISSGRFRSHRRGGSRAKLR